MTDAQKTKGIFLQWPVNPFPLNAPHLGGRIIQLLQAESLHLVNTDGELARSCSAANQTLDGSGSQTCESCSMLQHAAAFFPPQLRLCTARTCRSLPRHTPGHAVGLKAEARHGKAMSHLVELRRPQLSSEAPVSQARAGGALSGHTCGQDALSLFYTILVACLMCIIVYSSE